jgi:uncharacterized membrane-anchored protein
VNSQKETTIGTILAACGALAFAVVFYCILSTLFHFPISYAIPIAAIIGGVQYFALRHWLLVVGARKGKPKKGQLK